MGVGLPPVRDRLAICRSLRGQRRLEPDESMGEVLRGRDGFPQHPDLRRQRHLNRILGLDEQGHEQREWLCEVSHQRAG